MTNTQTNPLICASQLVRRFTPSTVGTEVPELQPNHGSGTVITTIHHNQ